MRKLRYLMLVAAAAIAFTGCSKEENPAAVAEKEAVTIKVKASAENLGNDTKTYINDENKTIYWGKGEYMTLAITSGGKTVFAKSTDKTADLFDGESQEAFFSFEISPETADTYKYQGIYPSSAVVATSNTDPTKYKVELPAVQNATASSYDPAAYIMVAKPTDFEEVSELWDTWFRRATALNKITLTNLDDDITSVEFIAPEKAVLAGRRYFNLSTGESGDIYYNQKNEITVNFATPQNGTVIAWFTSWNTELAENEEFKIVAKSATKSYTRNLKINNKGLKFEENKLNLLSVNMKEADVADVENLADGDYYIVVKQSGKFYAMSSTLSDNKSGLKPEELYDFDPDASYYSGNNDALIWTITNDKNSITIEQGTGNYLTVGDKKASISATKKTYTLADGKETPGTKFLNSVDMSGFGLRYNTSSKYFAFYSSAVSTTMLGEFYFMPADPRTRVAAPTNVEAEASGNTIIILWEDASDDNIDHYLVTLSGAADDSQVVAVGEQGYEFTGLSDGTYAVSVEAVPANTTLYINSLPETISDLVIGTVDTYTKCTGTLTSGWYVIGAVSGNTVYAINNTVGTSWIRYTEVTTSDGVITNPEDAIIWYYDADAGTIKNKDGVNYLYKPAGGNNGGCGTTSFPHTVTEQTTAGNYKVISRKETTRVLRCAVANEGYRYYTGNTGMEDICFFKKD